MRTEDPDGQVRNGWNRGHGAGGARSVAETKKVKDGRGHRADGFEDTAGRDALKDRAGVAWRVSKRKQMEEGVVQKARSGGVAKET